jgi:hypothetical protein
MKHRQRGHAPILAVLAAGMIATTAAQAVNLGFEDLPHDGEMQGVGDIVAAKGFILTYAPAPGEPDPVGFHSVAKSWRFNGRSTALNSNSCSSVVTLRSQTNLPFRLRSIDLAALNGDKDVVVSFLGITADSQYLRTTLLLAPNTVWKTYKLPETYTNLLEARWIQGDCIINLPHMFDNIRVHTLVAPDTADD